MSGERRRKAHRLGHLAEWLCIIWLVLKGYSILARRYKHPQGEIDIVALKGRIVVCVEVKARAGIEEALLSITPEKRYRTQAAASAFMAQHKKFLHHDLRFDVMVLTSRCRIYHLTNAWSVA